MKRNGEFIGTTAMSKDALSAFYTPTSLGAEVDGSSNIIDFNDGEFCSTFILTPADNSVGTITSTESCVNMIAPPCVLTSENSFEGVLDTSNYMMAYTANAQYTANAWCNPDDVSYYWTYVYESTDPVDYATLADYVTPLKASQTATITETKHESDFSISDTFTVSYESNIFTTQSDVNTESYSSFTHEQTCRPKFAQRPSIYDIFLEDSTNDL
jgi:hypothetical protein